MNKFKIGDKIIINTNSDLGNLFSGFYKQELIVTQIEDNSAGEKDARIHFKSTVTEAQDNGHYTFFKLSPQIGDRVRIISHGVEGDLNDDYYNELGTILHTSYLDNYPYFVKLDKTNSFNENYEEFVKEIELLEKQTKDITEQLSISDYAKYNNYSQFANQELETIATHYSNIDNLFCSTLINKDIDKVIQNTVITTTNNQGYKESEGKLNVEYDWEFLEACMKRMGKNKNKYKKDNWKQPIDIQSLKDSLFRHVLSVMNNKYNDDGDDFGHLSAIALNALFIYHQLKNYTNVNENKI